MHYNETWNLETIFPGKSTGPAFQARMKQLAAQLMNYRDLVGEWQTDQAITLKKVLAARDAASEGFGQCGSFLGCLESADVTDEEAKKNSGRLQALAPQFSAADTIFYKKLAGLAPDTLDEIIQNENLDAVAFRLHEMAAEGSKLLSTGEEKAIAELAVDGIHAWSAHYDTLVATIKIPFKGQELSAGQAFNEMMGSADAGVRSRLFSAWEAAWSEKAPLFADTLNHLSGSRLTDYRLHHEPDFLAEALRLNRLEKSTLEMMWRVVSAHKKPFVDFLERKAQLFGKEKMEWQDQDAPVILGDFSECRFSYDDGIAFILENFQKFSPKMAKFAQHALENRWVEAENRSGKAPGGFCTGFPENQESRIFMTYNGSVNEVSTLAHELGHAFHSSVMWDLPPLDQDYAMNVAETASTLAEMIVSDAAVQAAASDLEKINLLDAKLQNAIAMFMNIHARFLFETSYYEKRQAGLLSADELSQLMEEAQLKAYDGALATTHPHFWASKLHFYIDNVPFYNFPYTFGYLFSLGIYQYSRGKADFEEDYISLLRDTASMTTEELAKKHLHADLSQPDFWEAGIQRIEQDVAEFLKLTEAYLP